jgi:hypothetical protein
MSPLRLLTAGLFFWAALARAEHVPMRMLASRARLWSPRIPTGEALPFWRTSANAFESGPLFVPGLREGDESDRFMFGTFYSAPFGELVQGALGEFTLALGDDTNPVVRLGGEPFERRAFDFHRKCLNTCRLGGWGSCAVETRAKQDECEGIAGRTLVSAAARRAPLVRDILRLVGSRTTALPTDVELGLHLSAGLIRGGGTLGLEAKW